MFITDHIHYRPIHCRARLSQSTFITEHVSHRARFSQSTFITEHVYHRARSSQSTFI